MEENTLDKQTFTLTTKVAVSILFFVIGATFWTTNFYHTTKQNEASIEYNNGRAGRLVKNERERNAFILEIHSLKEDNKRLKATNCK